MSANNPPIKPCYKVGQFCEDFAVGRSFVYEEIRSGRLRTFKVGAMTLIAGEDALAWRESYRAASANGTTSAGSRA